MGARWKREQVQDHKFDFINVEDFIDNSCWRQFCYCMIFVVVIRGILVYCADIFTAVNLLANQNPDTFFPVDKETGDYELGFIKLPFAVYKYLFTGCIVLGLLLLAWDIRRAALIIKTRDIAFAFTSMIANRYYVIRSYPHYCLFSQINNSKKTVDELAFFCFFTFRGWKRLLLADAPRQVINASILVQTFIAAKRKAEAQRKKFDPFDLQFIVSDDPMKQITLCLMAFTVLIFASSLLQFLAACFIYLPLLSHIQGNLKEFCCHKIDKRIDELIRKKTKARALEASQGRSGGKNAKDIPLAPMKQPTLPQVDLSEPAPKPKRADTYKPSTHHYNAGPRMGNQYQGYNNYNNAHGNYNQGNGYNATGGYGNTGGGVDGYGYGNTGKDGYGYSDNQGTHPYYQQQQRTPTAVTTNSSATKGINPYADTAYTTPDDVYDAYSTNYDQQYLNSQNINDPYSSPLSPDTTYYDGGSNTAVSPTSPTRPQRYNTDYSLTSQQTGYPFPYQQQQQQQPPRPSSPIQSQHGSELDGSHHSSGHGGYNNNAYGYNNQYGNGGSNGGGYGQTYGGQYSSPTSPPPQMPQRGRRQDTGHSRY
ncbi:hypothetical protein BGW41_001641 [Actinomortierella wolfii]|nr:hypothetical protein BGW41_001641 [Actinomortierella wolfii]